MPAAARAWAMVSTASAPVLLALSASSLAFWVDFASASVASLALPLAAARDYSARPACSAAASSLSRSSVPDAMTCW